MFLLIANRPGYLPDDMGDQPEYETYQDAAAALTEQAEELEENGYDIEWGCCHRNWLSALAKRGNEAMFLSIAPVED